MEYKWRASHRIRFYYHKKGEVTRITFNNLTMMHHPMHLHGHYFRVINENGEKSPLKHTVNVPSMGKVTIEFLGEEEGYWIFHCHVLYHMMSGMTRMFSYGNARNPLLANYPMSKMMKEMNQYFTWSTVNIASHYSSLNFTSSNLRNEFDVDAEFAYTKNLEAEFSYNRYVNDWTRVYFALQTENKQDNEIKELNTVLKMGVKYFTPYMFNLNVSIDNQFRPEIVLNKEFLLFPRFFVNGEISYRADFGFINEMDNHYQHELNWIIGAELMLHRNVSLMGNYNSKYGIGGGLTLRL